MQSLAFRSGVSSRTRRSAYFHGRNVLRRSKGLHLPAPETPWHGSSIVSWKESKRACSTSSMSNDSSHESESHSMPSSPLHETTQAINGHVGIVIVDHGSRKKDSNDMLHEFGKLYQDMYPGSTIVEVAHMEISEPSIEQAIGKCALRGAGTVVIAPYFLSRGRHIQEDIPKLVQDAQKQHPGIKCIVAQPIGIDPLMAQLIRNRVTSAMEVSQEEAPLPADVVFK